MTFYYSRPPDVEVFHLDEEQARQMTKDRGLQVGGLKLEPGWFYWYCYPGRSPNSDLHGPFNTEGQAISDFYDETPPWNDL